MTSRKTKPTALVSLADLARPGGHRPILSMPADAFDGTPGSGVWGTTEALAALRTIAPAYLAEGSALYAPGTREALDAVTAAEAAEREAEAKAREARDAARHEYAGTDERRAHGEAEKTHRAASTATHRARVAALRTIYDVPADVREARATAYADAYEAAHEAATEALDALTLALSMRNASAALAHAEAARSARDRDEEPPAMPPQARTWHTGHPQVLRPVAEEVSRGWSAPDAASKRDANGYTWTN